MKKPCFKRWFGKLSPGSLRGSILALLATAVGSGVLSLPYVALKSGVLIAAILLVLGAVVAYISMA
jgi:amino acid permease